MHPTNCLNCGTILTADDHFCPTCGQKTNTHRFTISHILHEFFHSFTHADKSFLGMIADLAVKPGTVAKEFVAGKRKKYFSPFTFFILSIGILVFSSHLFKAVQEERAVDPKVLAQMPNEAAKKYYMNLVHRTNEGMEFMSKRLNTVAMLVLPFYAFLSWIFFRKRGYNYSEMLVAFMLFQSFVSLVMAVLVIPWIARYKDQSIVLYIFIAVLLLMSVYVGAAQYKFLGFKNGWMFLVTSLVALLGYVLVFVIMVLVIFYYIFQSNTGTVLKTMWQKYF